ncbi:hypothetical protein AQUCO_00900160v1 [Aquilegia coerulea]|uniref:G-patch domain-containing protein n=1 Tax=Aquilegia coerulea TaxID=218851 RepID=A0A2G5EC96_AQUCA|nr:hypothetical protein AQUCO_00900160v1 [Aquilegia coerulea]PIA53390.1 hypothetical protein AQUCO_00900160v1 [Aquilegia coerulea]PIA53391.1 hypothetical protein AQUCO_00900160v1 [Aquilegia coerulea]
MAAQVQDGEDDDYMADLSRFLPPEETSRLSNKNLNFETLANQPSKKKLKTLINWQQQRKIDREKKQREEDEKTLVNMESAIPQSNIGFKMLKQMGYKPGSALGKDGSGQAQPVGLEIRRSRAGVGREDPVKEKIRIDLAKEENQKKEEENLMLDFGTRKKSEWRIRRVIVNYRKARASLAQLENEDIILEPKKKKEEEDGVKHDKEEEGAEQEDKEEEEEEEEVITEEDLHDILMKLRNEHLYCLFCGCQYESMEALSSHCPGLDEDDH